MAKKRIKKIKEIIEELKVEIAEGITSEKIVPIYFDNDRLKRQPALIYRLDIGNNENHRYYYRFDEANGNEPVFYTSVTTMIKNTLPIPPQLIKWIADRGTEDSSAEANERAAYGTFLHIQIGELLIFGKYNLDELPKKLEAFALKEKVTPKPDWITELKKDILAFSQFIIDRNVRPIAIEIVLFHPDDNYAGAIDIVCEMDEEEKGFFGETYASGARKGEPKESKRTIRVSAIVDIKSGRKGFHESHEIQLHAYKEMFQIHFPDVPIHRVYNWSPKDWRNSPSYNLKDQTESKSARKLPHLVALSKIEDSKRDNMVAMYDGVVDPTKGLGCNISYKSLVELVKERQ